MYGRAMITKALARDSALRYAYSTFSDVQGAREGGTLLAQRWSNQREMLILGALIGATVGAWVGARARDYAAAQSRPRVIDWERARTIAIRMNASSRLSASERVALTRYYRSLVERAVPLIADYTGETLPSPAEHVYAFDRIDWIDANLEGFAEVLRPLEMLPDLPGQPALRLGLLVWGRLSQAVATTEVGLLLGYLARRVLGQYDLVLLGREPLAAGRLYFVEPNVAWLERVLRLDGSDFRFWLALHETTHAFEFEAHPWLRDYVNGLIHDWVRLLQADTEALKRVWQAVRDLPSVVRGDSERSWLELFMSPEQRALFQRLQAVMALIEGYSNHVMHAVGRSIIPTYWAIVHQFERRQQQRSPAEQLLARLTGLDLKLEQYRLGEAFADHVVQNYGHDMLRFVWEGPDYLPTVDELRAPDRWVERVRRRPVAEDVPVPGSH